MYMVQIGSDSRDDAEQALRIAALGRRRLHRAEELTGLASRTPSR